MAIQWSTTSAAGQSQGVKMLVYSGAGAGKTSLCATAPKPVVISAEAGLLSLQPKNIARMYGADNPNVTYDIPVMQVTTMAQLVEAYTFFANPQSGARDHFSTICIDSLTELAEVMLAGLKATKSDPRQAYGELIDKMGALVRQFRDLPGYHVYMSAKMEYSKDEGSGLTKYQPSMPGSKLGQQLPYFFDEVFHLGVNRTQQGQAYRFLLTQPDMQYVAKDRSGSLDEMEMPALYNVINKILGA